MIMFIFYNIILKFPQNFTGSGHLSFLKYLPLGLGIKIFSPIATFSQGYRLFFVEWSPKWRDSITEFERIKNP